MGNLLRSNSTPVNYKNVATEREGRSGKYLAGGDNVWHSLPYTSTSVSNIHLLYGPKGNSLFCFPESSDVSLDFVLRNIRTRGHAVVFGARATTAQLYPGRDTFEFDQSHVTKNQPITVLVLMSESLGIQHYKIID